MTDAIQNTVVSTKDQLVEFLVDGCKPPEDWRIGTEHEKFAFDPETSRTLAYEGTSGVREILERMCRFGWEPVLENGNPIGLKKPDNSSISLEPGGQIELSGAPLETHSPDMWRINQPPGTGEGGGWRVGRGLSGFRLYSEMDT